MSGSRIDQELAWIEVDLIPIWSTTAAIKGFVHFSLSHSLLLSFVRKDLWGAQVHAPRTISYSRPGLSISIPHLSLAYPPPRPSIAASASSFFSCRTHSLLRFRELRGWNTSLRIAPCKKTARCTFRSTHVFPTSKLSGWLARIPCIRYSTKNVPAFLRELVISHQFRRLKCRVYGSLITEVRF